MLSTNVTMPLHVRYHRPFRGPSHVPVEVVLPEVYVACHPGSRGVPQASGFLIYRGHLMLTLMHLLSVTVVNQIVNQCNSLM